jgi:DNA-directed RNA polymerase subunit L
MDPVGADLGGISPSPCCVYDVEEARSPDATSATLHMRGMDEGLGHAVAYMLGEDEDVEFCAYHQVHPYQDHHLIRITTEEDPLGSKWHAAWERVWSILRQTFQNVERALSIKRQDPRGIVRVSGDAIRIQVSMKTPPVVANVLRRYVLSDVPVYAFTRFEVFRNNTNISDEQICHRIGQLPLRVASDGTQSGSHSCSQVVPGSVPLVEAELDVVLPPLRDQEERASEKWVHSTEIAFKTPGVSIRAGEECDPPFPLVALVPGAQLRLRAFAEVGTGSRHARFSSALQSHYKIRGDWVDLGFDMIGQREARECVQLAVRSIQQHCLSYIALDCGVGRGTGTPHK